jgi:HlyD family secretion protein
VTRWIKRILGTLVAGAIVAAIVYSFLPKPTPVDVAQASRGELQVYVEEDGKTRLRDRYTISAPLAGRLQRIRLKAGDVVPKGQPVAVIEPADPELLGPRALALAEARVKAARSMLERTGTAMEAARAGLDLAEAEFARATELYQRAALAKTDLDVKLMQRRTKNEEFRAARYSEEVARFELEQAEAAMLRTRPREAGVAPGPGENDHFEIHAPPVIASGHSFHVLRVFQESAGFVNPGANLLELGDPTDLEVEIDVLSSDAVKVLPGNRVLLEQWGGDGPLEGRVRLVEPSGFTKISALGVEEQRVYVIVDFPDRAVVPSNLGDGYRVEAKIIIWEKDDVLRVPTSALFRHDSEWAVFVVDRGRAMRRVLEVGKRNALFAEVQKGLELGESVVIHPSDKVTDGALVVPR